MISEATTTTTTTTGQHQGEGEPEEEAAAQHEAQPQRDQEPQPPPQETLSTTQSSASASASASSTCTTFQQTCPSEMPAGVCRASAAATAAAAATTTTTAERKAMTRENNNDNDNDNNNKNDNNNDNNNNNNNHNNNDDTEEDGTTTTTHHPVIAHPTKLHDGCHVYMAPSTLGNATNLGMYTAVELPPESVVNFPELVVPLLFREWNQATHAPAPAAAPSSSNSRPRPRPHHRWDGKVWDRYVWEGSVLNVESYNPLDVSASRAALVPGVGCTVNSHLELHNIHSARGSRFDTAGVSRRNNDPGAGAFSPYHDARTTTVATRSLPAGTELLAKYGEYWIPQIPTAQVTLQKYWQQAEDFLQNVYFPFVLDTRSGNGNGKLEESTNHSSSKEQGHNGDTSSRPSPMLQEALWNFTITFPIYNPALTNLPRDYPWHQVLERYYQIIIMRQLLYPPAEPRGPSGDDDDDYDDEEDDKEAEEEEEDASSQDNLNNNKVDDDDDDDDDEDSQNFILKYLQEDDGVVTSFLRQQQVRPVSWLQQHGYCQDFLRPGDSLIDQAGRGAFATRHLPRGTIVAYAPLIHIGLHGRTLWNIRYDNDNDNDNNSDNSSDNGDGRYQYDLILNYSFGHPNSTVLLTPYGAMVNYINHNSQAPNVRVQWPQHELVAHKPDWLHQSPEFLSWVTDQVGLSLEYVALRDIQPGEEVVMDYGPAWEQAWNHFVAHWQPLSDAHHHVLAQDVLAHEPTPYQYFRTVHELSHNPYPYNVATLCIPSFTRLTDHHPEAARRRRHPQRPVYQWIAPATPSGNFTKSFPHRMFCIVTERREIYNDNDNNKDKDDVTYLYTVDLKWNPATTGTATPWVWPSPPSPSDDDDDDDGNNDGNANAPPQPPPVEPHAPEWVRLVNVPPEGLGLYNLAFTNDWHMPNVFRHEIGIPNDIMPKAWLNLNQ
ncbi:hypothetical protein ACA910_017598 [Epithemia clementina (nom. ined.)]